MKELGPPPARPPAPVGGVEGRWTVEGWFLVTVALAVAVPSVVLVWAVSTAVLARGRVRRWHLATSALVTATPLVLVDPAAIPARLAAGVSQYAGTPGRPSWGLLVAALGHLLRAAVVTLPVGIPLGLLAAAVPWPAHRYPPMPGHELAERAAAERADARARARAVRLAERAGHAASTERPGAADEALAVAIDGDLTTWRDGRYVVPPAGHFGLTTILAGASGTGKSTTIERIAWLCGRERRELCLIDGKGTDGLDQAVIAAYLHAWPEARVACFPQRPVDLWRGSPQRLANRIAAAWQFSDEAEFYEQAAMLGLRFAFTQPGPPCRSSVELVRRLDPAALVAAWGGHPTEVSVIRGMEKRLADVALRASNLAAALGPAWDGDWWLGDVDLACFTVPTLDNPKDGDAAMRVLLAAYGQYLVGGPHRDRHLVFDEFSSLQGGRPYAINLVERARSSGSGVTLAGQSAAGLGEPRDRERLLASANTVILFRSPMPAELAALAGVEDAWAITHTTGPAGHSYSMSERHTGRVDQQQVRQARVGEAEVISEGRKLRGRIIRTAIPPATMDRARAITTGEDQPCATAPAGADATRELPAPPPPPQGQAAPPSPPATLDPAGPPRVRRHRPPPAGRSGPGSARNNQEVT